MRAPGLLDRMQSQSKRETYADVGGGSGEGEDGPNLHTVSGVRNITREGGGAVDPRTGNLIGNPGKAIWLLEENNKQSPRTQPRENADGDAVCTMG